MRFSRSRVSMSVNAASGLLAAGSSANDNADGSFDTRTLPASTLLPAVAALPIARPSDFAFVPLSTEERYDVMPGDRLCHHHVVVRRRHSVFDAGAAGNCRHRCGT